MVTGGGKLGRLDRRRKLTKYGYAGFLRSVRAVISSEEDSKTAAGVLETSKGSNGFLGSSRNSGMELRAVVTIRKKMKEKLVDKVEDQWVSLINGIGRGILIQLISEDIDPGQFLSCWIYLFYFDS